MSACTSGRWDRDGRAVSGAGSPPCDWPCSSEPPARYLAAGAARYLTNWPSGDRSAEHLRGEARPKVDEASSLRLGPYRHSGIRRDSEWLRKLVTRELRL